MRIIIIKKHFISQGYVASFPTTVSKAASAERKYFPKGNRKQSMRRPRHLQEQKIGPIKNGKEGNCVFWTYVIQL